MVVKRKYFVPINGGEAKSYNQMNGACSMGKEEVDGDGDDDSANE